VAIPGLCGTAGRKLFMPLSLKSLPRICVALGFPDAQVLLHAAEQEYRDGNTFLEFRLDYLRKPESGVAVIEQLKRQYPDLRLLATCRHHLNHGGFKGSVDQQFSLLCAAASAGAELVDLEVEHAEPLAKRLPELRKLASLIVSYHNFENTPALTVPWRRLRRIDADAYKLVTTARKPGDSLRMCEFFRAKREVPLVAFAMGEPGVSTRVLSLASGCLYTYAAPIENEGTAAGQIPAKAMRSLYRADKLNKRSRVYGVIADPIAHSKSPLVHNRAFHVRRIDAVYLPFLVASSQLGDWMKLAAELPVAGFSVTIPHKQKILRYLDIVEPLARRIGAVNTVWRRAGKWRGANTDVAGILKPLERHLRISRAKVLLAGYGGAARAAAFGLKDAGAELTITGRNLERGQTLAKAVGAGMMSVADASKAAYDVLINATPVGMYPNTDACLFTNRVPGAVVFDMVYNPRETALIRKARDQGATVICGHEMFLEQAAQQFEIWTGESAPRSVMCETLDASS
jgi:3-dehydroquinate dehydratase/shikimate dehydrogenase